MTTKVPCGIQRGGYSNLYFKQKCRNDCRVITDYELQNIIFWGVTASESLYAVVGLLATAVIESSASKKEKSRAGREGHVRKSQNKSGNGPSTNGEEKLLEFLEQVVRS